MRLGADPEVFLRDGTGKMFSVIGLIGADKYNPMQIPGMEKGFTLQEDNVALEFGIPPADSADRFFEHINTVMESSKTYLKGLNFSKLSCTVFPEDQMQHPLAYVFGCEPDYNAWTGAENTKPQPPHEFMRSAGGHVHVETKQKWSDVVKAMDTFLSIPAVFMDEGVERKQLYGKSGACRIKPYGVEYRTLSNFWIAPEGTEEERRKLCHWVWRNTERALKADMTEIAMFGQEIQTTINNNDKQRAEKLIKYFDLEVI